jgi:cell division protein FtsW
LAAVLFGLLLLVLNGKVINGSRRWLDLGFFSVQPSEFAKIAVVICVAVFLDRCSWRIGLFRNGFMFPLLIIAFFATPIICQPDYGSVLVIGVLGLLTMLVCGVKWRYFVLIGVAAIAVIGIILKNNPNRMARINAWLGKEVEIGVQVSKSASDNAAYQAKQSLVAIKNGGVFGVGLYNSMQKEHYLPEAHTDFIFAIGAEELGLFFSLGVIILFTIYFGLSLYIAKHSADRFGRAIAIGMAYLVYMQAMINIGVVCSALPTKGMALPFFSYGGTNLITVGIATGMIFSVGIRALKEKKRAFLKRIVV